MQLGKKGVKFIEITTKLSKFPKFFIFDNIVPILDPLPTFTSMRNTIGSGLKRVATGGVSKKLSDKFICTTFKNITGKRKTSFVQ